eukprot:scaffold647859_cov44-Prasinocladus_malaysianus.AAC.2
MTQDDFTIQTCRRLNEALLLLPQFAGEPQRSWVLPLHSSVPPEEQRLVFQRPPEGVHKARQARPLSQISDYSAAYATKLPIYAATLIPPPQAGSAMVLAQVTAGVKRRDNAMLLNYRVATRGAPVGRLGTLSEQPHEDWPLPNRPSVCHRVVAELSSWPTQFLTSTAYSKIMVLQIRLLLIIRDQSVLMPLAEVNAEAASSRTTDWSHDNSTLSGTIVQNCVPYAKIHFCSVFCSVLYYDSHILCS